MDIEELSKAQLLLLTVMVNFVVSIATGVLTVSLLDQAPITVTQGVNRVIDHTIQTIATPIQVVNPIKSITSSLPSSSPSPTNEQLVTQAVGDAVARTVLIHKASTTTPAIAFGTYLPKSRVIATATVSGLPKEAIVEFSDGTAVEASLSKTSGSVAIYGFADDAVLPGAPDAALVLSSKLKQGQTVVALTKDSAAITGIISKVDGAGIQTSLQSVPVGADVVDLSGHVVGIGSATSGLLIPAETITSLLEAPAATKK